MMRFFFFTLYFSFLLIPNILSAQEQVNPDSTQPLEITAQGSLEWHRNEKFFEAHKNVKAVQGRTTLISDLLTAKYREEKQGGMKIHTVIAEGSVQIISAQSKAYGDHAVYDIDKGYAVMTGNNLRLISPDQSVTAQDRMEYWVMQGRLQAIGHAVAIREGDKIEADILTAIFKQDNTGKRVLESMKASGNVVITTPTEVLTGNEATYDAKTNLAQIIGAVKVTRGLNVLEGEKAEVDLNTNISKMFGGGDKGGRVRGIFYPEAEKKREP